MWRVWLFAALGFTAIGVLAWSQRRHEVPVVSGFIEAQDIRVGSRVGGRTLAVHVAEGKPVRHGEPLVTLEPYDLREQLAEAEASHSAATARHERMRAGLRVEEREQASARRAEAQARVDRLVAGLRPLEKQILRDKLALAQAELVKAQYDFNRVKDLMDRGSGMEQELTDKRRALDVAQARVAQAQDELALGEEGTRSEELAEARAVLAAAEAADRQAQSGYRQEEIAEAEAQAKAAAARADAIRRQLDELTIAAPCDGYVEAIDLRPGDLVAPGAPVASIIDPAEMWVRAYMPERFVGIALGSRLRVVVSAVPQHSFIGELAYVSREAEFTPANVQTPEERSKQVFRIKVVIREGVEHLRAGMSADVWLEPVKL